MLNESSAPTPHNSETLIFNAMTLDWRVADIARKSALFVSVQSWTDVCDADRRPANNRLLGQIELVILKEFDFSDSLKIHSFTDVKPRSR